jgi:hypothetical protein
LQRLEAKGRAQVKYPLALRVRVAQKHPLILTFSPEEGVEKHLFAVIPAGIPKPLRPMDSCAGMTANQEFFISRHPPEWRRNW